MTHTRTALGIIDVQRGFMPSSESERYWKDGFGELPIADGQEIIPVIDRLLQELGAEMVFTTQDWHPTDTAHFSEEPNFETTWPIHCVANTDGAELHPALTLPERTYVFKKGYEPIDTSYSGYNSAILTDFNEPLTTLPEMLDKHDIRRVVLGGLALDYCVKATAIDIVRKTDVEVFVAWDATRPVDEMSGIDAVHEMRESGIRVMKAREIIELLHKEQS